MAPVQEDPTRPAPVRPPEPSRARVFSRAGVRALDHAAATELAIPTLLLMEHAALALREAALGVLSQRGLDRVCILCGPGNNGGDGLALARLLWLDGRNVRALLIADPARVKGDAGMNLQIAQRLGLPLEMAPGGPPAPLAEPARTLLVDALVGTGLERPLDGAIAAGAAWINRQRDAGATVLAVDVPSGLDADTGRPLGDVAVRADLTVTLAGMKRGLLNPASRAYAGEVRVGSICLPDGLLDRYADPS